MNDIQVQVVEGLVITPGDTLVVKAPAEFPPETVGHLHDALRAELPQGAKVVIIHGEVEFVKAVNDDV